jgi:hypothetical protein
MYIKTERIINASYNKNTIRVYQAYNNAIADECINLGTFGDRFKLERMTWIKPSFLWMMYRAGWGRKENQERILGIDITHEGFREILMNVVLSTYEEKLYGTYDNWKNKLDNSLVRCQWDPDRDIYGNRANRSAIQLGLKGELVRKYIDEYIVSVEDMTPKVIKWIDEIEAGNFKDEELPIEREYKVDMTIQKMLGMS